MNKSIISMRSLNAKVVLMVLFSYVFVFFLVTAYVVGGLVGEKSIFPFFFLSSLGVIFLFSLAVICFLVRRFSSSLSEMYRVGLMAADDPLCEKRVAKCFDDEVGRVVDVFNDLLDKVADDPCVFKFSEKRFRTLSDKAPIGVFLRNDLGQYEYTNSRWHEITGIEKSMSFTSCVSAADVEHYESLVRRAFIEGKTQVVEFRFLNPVRGERILMEYISHVKDESGVGRYMGSLLDVTELKIAQSELEKLAFYDPLTLLPNRRFFRDHLDLAMAKSKKENIPLAIYMTDLDEFKKVNDSLGHTSGDQLLVDISKKLGAVVSDGDVISRFGGDEFIVLIDAAEDRRQLDNKAAAVLESMTTMVNHGTSKIQITGCIGIALYPDDANTPEELFRCADMALYAAKANGRNNYSYYSQALDRKVNEKIQLENKLRAAIVDDVLEVYLQPQYLSSTKKIYWAEALVRWKDTKEGFISPNKFIPLAEETGLIFDIGDLVLDKVLCFLSEYSSTLSVLGVQGISVNLSAKQFFDTDFKEKIRGKFQYHGVSPQLIEFEITETTVMDDVDRAIEIMESLRVLGCRLSIDDFGTGYSSLSYLKKFPITSLKIDKSFIRDIPLDESDVEISCAIIALAHNMGLSVVAEGVETEIQAQFMTKYNCEYMQGFYFDKPMPFSKLLERAPLLVEENQL